MGNNRIPPDVLSIKFNNASPRKVILLKKENLNKKLVKMGLKIMDFARGRGKNCKLLKNSTNHILQKKKLYKI